MRKGVGVGKEENRLLFPFSRSALEKNVACVAAGPRTRLNHTGKKNEKKNKTTSVYRLCVTPCGF